MAQGEPELVAHVVGALRSYDNTMSEANAAYPSTSSNTFRSVPFGVRVVLVFFLKVLLVFLRNGLLIFLRPRGSIFFLRALLIFFLHVTGPAIISWPWNISHGKILAL
jgi:hypothetical protein